MRALTPFLALALAAPLLSGCVEEDPTFVALLLADGRGGNTSTADERTFVERVAERCEGCDVEVLDAVGSSSRQASQVEQAVAEKADVLVVEPVDAEAVAGVAHGEVPLVSLGTFVEGSDSFVGMAEGVEEDAADEEGSAGEPTSDFVAAREIIMGKRRRMTYLPASAISAQAADVAVGLLVGEPAPDASDHLGTPAWLFEATEVTLANLTTVLVGSGAYTLENLCAGATEKHCSRHGLT